MKTCTRAPLHVVDMTRMEGRPNDQGVVVAKLENALSVGRVREASSASYRDCFSALLELAPVEGVAPNCDGSRVCAVDEGQRPVTENPSCAADTQSVGAEGSGYKQKAKRCDTSVSTVESGDAVGMGSDVNPSCAVDTQSADAEGRVAKQKTANHWLCIVGMGSDLLSPVGDGL